MLKTATLVPPSSTGPAFYRPRRPAATVLHRTVREHFETYLATAGRDEDLASSVPLHVQNAFREYLRCGILAHGFARAYCSACGHDFLIAFSCKGRDICPSCATRRMVETAAHLTDQVLPRVPYRQWVLSVPKRVRWHLREKPQVIGGLLRIFLRAADTTLRRRSPGRRRRPNWGSSRRFRRPTRRPGPRSTRPAAGTAEIEPTGQHRSTDTGNDGDGPVCSPCRRIGARQRETGTREGAGGHSAGLRLEAE